MYRRAHRDKNFPIKITAVFLGLIILAVGFFYKMRPLILKYASSSAEVLMLNAANDAILDILNEEGVSYNDMINLSQNADGQIISLETDIVKFNTLKSLMANRLSENIAKKEYYDIHIPLGTFFSSLYTSGLGPKIRFKMQLSAVAKVDFSHEFKSAGINQVLHLVKADMNISGGLVIAGYKGSISASTSVIAAQTIIVGAVPEAYTNVVENENDNTAGLINDYGAVAGK